MSLPRYPAYKDSGVAWLGEVPSHWDVCGLKRIVGMQSGESITAETIEKSGEFPVFGGNGLRGFTSAFTHDGHSVLIGILRTSTSTPLRSVSAFGLARRDAAIGRFRQRGCIGTSFRLLRPGFLSG